ncbi:hypothetical protein IV102_26095 [bacterium]|nr:hypothetical protein [bacterium]
MKRLVLTFILVTMAEIYAFWVFRSHPISRPDYFPALLTVIQFFMSYGGIESARWLLRKSPVARTPGPDSDWTRLWIWLGLPGGLLMVATSGLAWLASTQTTSWLSPAILLGHAAGGGILWLCASLEMLPSLARIQTAARRLNGNLALMGLFTHLLGLYFYAKVYPAGQLKVGLFIVAVLLTYFVFYYVWAACMFWAIIFRFWTPPTDASADGSQG